VIDISFNSPVNNVVAAIAGYGSLQIWRFYRGAAGIAQAIMGQDACFRIKIANTGDANGTNSPSGLLSKVDFFHAA